MELIFSDLHADINALNSIIDIATTQEFQEKYGELSKIVNLGDILERGTHPKPVLKKLESLAKIYSIHSVMGNHDEAFLYNRIVSGSSLESLDVHSKLCKEDLAFFQKNKDGTYGSQQFIDKKNNLICVHGGPIDPKLITPENAGEKSWLYQKSWQRISESEFEFFSFAGYHYSPLSAFKEGKKNFKNFIILCGHQHTETAIKEDQDKISEILSDVKPSTEKIEKFTLKRKEILIDPLCNYIIRVGLGGPEGYYGLGTNQPHFGILLDNPRRVILFEINSL